MGETCSTTYIARIFYMIYPYNPEGNIKLLRRKHSWSKNYNKQIGFELLIGYN